MGISGSVTSLLVYLNNLKLVRLGKKMLISEGCNQEGCLNKHWLQKCEIQISSANPIIP